MIGNMSEIGTNQDVKLSNAELLDRLFKMDCGTFTKFMRNIDAIGSEDFVDFFSMETLNATIVKAVADGYTVSLKGLNSKSSKYIYVRYINSPYGKTCEIQAYGDTKYREMPFNFDCILRDHAADLAMMGTGLPVAMGVRR
jgi:hypothetical protein